MRPLTIDDLMPLPEFASRRQEFLQALARYLDRYRRVRVGPKVTLVFENRQTLWFRVQDLLRVARLADPARVQEELDLYNRLLPGPSQLQAAFIVSEDLSDVQELRGDHLRLHVGQREFPAVLVTCRPEDHVDGTAHWMQFTFTEDDRRHFANFRLPAHLALSLPSYSHESMLLNEDVRQSLLDDLNS